LINFRNKKKEGKRSVKLEKEENVKYGRRPISED
jgi:hypothetical protein